MKSIWSVLAAAAALSVTLNEIVEGYAGDKNHWFNHVHLWAEDVRATSEWFERHLGRVFSNGARRPCPAESSRRWSNAFCVDGFSFVII